MIRRLRAPRKGSPFFVKKSIDKQLYYSYNTVNRITRVIQFGNLRKNFTTGRTMITFDAFKPTEGTPIYQQILLYIKRGAIAGTIRNGDELPSRRVLSALLGINPNTVQKAFKMLEDEALIESQAGAKSTMTLDGEKIAKLCYGRIFEASRRHFDRWASAVRKPSGFFRRIGRRQNHERALVSHSAVDSAENAEGTSRASSDARRRICRKIFLGAAA